MIHGVIIKPLKVWKDIPDVPLAAGSQSGFLMEVARDDDGLLKKFGQSTFTVAYYGTIKAFHWHKLQDDVWFVATGKAKVVLHDLRDDSPTKGETQVIYAGVDDYKTILIPIGVAHGYQVVSQEPVLLFYHTTEHYNAAAPDEQRIAYDDRGIGFDWSTK
jgi:dTDP-4-dehydrorhamnose 3,5-epimerase